MAKANSSPRNASPKFRRRWSPLRDDAFTPRVKELSPDIVPSIVFGNCSNPCSLVGAVTFGRGRLSRRFFPADPKPTTLSQCGSA